MTPLQEVLILYAVAGTGALMLWGLWSAAGRFWRWRRRQRDETIAEWLYLQHLELHRPPNLTRTLGGRPCPWCMVTHLQEPPSSKATATSGGGPTGKGTS